MKRYDDRPVRTRNTEQQHYQYTERHPTDASFNGVDALILLMAVAFVVVVCATADLWAC